MKLSNTALVRCSRIYYIDNKMTSEEIDEKKKELISERKDLLDFEENRKKEIDSEKRNFYDEYIEVFESQIEKAMEDVFEYWHTVTRVEENSVKPFDVTIHKVVDGYIAKINVEVKVDRDV